VRIKPNQARASATRSHLSRMYDSSVSDECRSL
jgi:hypothetical protein